MAVPAEILRAKGMWRGTSQLHQSYLPPEKRVAVSDSRLHIETSRHDAFATITYTWAHEGEAHEGTMLVAMGAKSEHVEIGWTDTWHQSTGVMHLVGTAPASGSLSTKGSFDAGGETWGWTISIGLTDDALTLTMENVTPGGEAEWAVRATYHRE